MQDRPTTPRFSDDGILGPRIAPASPPTRSTRLAAQRRRKRCGSGMGSRVLMRLSPHKPLSGWPRTLFAKVKQQRRGFTGIFEIGVGPTSLEIEMGRGPVRRGSPRHALVVIPMAAKDCFGFMSHMRPTALRLRTASPALSALTVLLRGWHFPQAFPRNQSRQSETVWATCAPMPVCWGEFPHDAASEWGATPREHPWRH